MEEKWKQTWILKDVDIEIRFRSGSSDLGILRELLKDIMSSLVESGISGTEIIEHEEKVISTPKRSLRVISTKLRIE